MSDESRGSRDRNESEMQNEHGDRHDESHQSHDESHQGHDHHAHDLSTVGVAVVTVSSTRSLDDDPSGDVIETTLENAGHDVVLRELVADEFDHVQGVVDRCVNREDVDAVVTTGGTGVTVDDVTVEAVTPLFEKRLPGFGELFRTLSFDEIGTRVVATRTTAGIADGVPVFCLPGSENAARLGTEEIVVPEVPHLAGLAHQSNTN